MNAIRLSAKAVIIQDRQVLVIQKRDAQGDYYLLPGGGQLPGETLPDAVRRECREELGAAVEVGELRFVREYIGSNHEFAEEDGAAHQVECMFDCALREQPGQPVAPDIGQVGWAWLPLATILTFRLYPLALRPLLGAAAGPPIYLGDVN